MKELLKTEFLGNMLYDYITALIIITGAVILIQIIRRILIRIIKPSGDEAENKKFDFVSKNIRKLVVPFLYLGSSYIALSALKFDDEVKNVINISYLVFSTWFVIRIIIAAMNFFINKYFEKVRAADDEKKIKPLISLLNFVVWIIGLLILLDNIGFKVSAVVTGLGITGIAVALAAQALLGDLFSYFVIFFDKPFEIGDFVVFDDKKGTVEHVGIKSTKIRAISGELLIISNSNLTSSRLHNFKKMEKRRVVFILGVTYQTPYDKLKIIPEIIGQIINNNENVEFDRCHFTSYGAFSLDFETVYFINSPDFLEYRNITQSIYLRIYEEFEKQGIEFAYPTQTLYVNKNGGNTNQ